jgi:hypothetical protein
MVLQEKLRDTKMTKTDRVTSFFMRFSQICGELEAVGNVIVQLVLVQKGKTNEGKIGIT